MSVETPIEEADLTIPKINSGKAQSQTGTKTAIPHSASSEETQAVQTALGAALDVNLDAIAQNYRYFQDRAPNATMAAVVKCDGYGLGASKVSQHLYKDCKCRNFFVATPREGITLRKVFSKHLGEENGQPSQCKDPTIYVLNGVDANSMVAMREYHLSPVLNTRDQAELWADHGQGIGAALHIDTGMNRLGISPHHLSAIKSRQDLKLSLLMSHLACAADQASPENARQRARLLDLALEFPHLPVSLSATGGAELGEGFAFSMVRLGIGLYGCTVTGERHSKLKPTARLTAPVLQIRQIRPGEPVGYDSIWRAQKPSVIATVAMGYGDGVFRALTHAKENLKPKVWINGGSYPLVGKISMDLITVDISEARTHGGISIGDQVELFGPNLPVERLAEACNTISYEMFTNIGARVVRRYRHGW